MSQDPFSGINAFVSAAKAQSFTKAGLRLGQTPSSISKAIGRLEQELSVKLFHRSARAVTLTSEGEAFFNECQHLVETAENARNLLSERRANAQGRLRVAVPVSFGQQVMAKALASWQQAQTGIELDLVLTDRNVDLIQERFDLAFCFHQPPDKRIVAKPLKTPKFITAASSDYLQVHGLLEHPNQLAAHNCLAYVDPHSQQVRRWEFQKNNQSISHSPVGTIQADQGNVLLEVAKQGGGIIHAPRYLIAQALAEKKLIPLLAEFNSQGPQWSLVYPYQRKQSKILHAFIDFVVELVEECA